MSIDTIADLPDGWFEIDTDGDDRRTVVGPGGLFDLRIRRHPAGDVRVYDHTVLVRGRRTERLDGADARTVAAAVSAACGFEVTCEPVVLIASGDLEIRSRPDDIHVLPADLFERWLQHMPRRLSDETIERILDGATRRAA